MDYPASLPAMTISGYAVRAGSLVERVTDNVASVSQRRRVVNVPSAVTGRWVFTGAQMVVFRDWLRANHNGVHWSDISVIVGAGIKTVSVRLIESYEATIVAGDKWEVTAEFEIRNLPLITEAELDAILDRTSGLDPDIVMAMADRLHHYVHVDKPGKYDWNYNG